MKRVLVFFSARSAGAQERKERRRGEGREGRAVARRCHDSGFQGRTLVVATRPRGFGVIRTFQILRKATNSAECCLFRRVFVISAVCSFLAERFKYPATSFRPDFWEGPGREYDFPAGVWRKGVWRLRAKRLSPEAGGGEAAWCDGSRRAGELTPGSTRVKKPKSWRSACAL